MEEASAAQMRALREKVNRLGQQQEQAARAAAVQREAIKSEVRRAAGGAHIDTSKDAMRAHINMSKGVKTRLVFVF